MERMDYERPGVAETYARARALPDEALDLWRDVLRALDERRMPTRAALRATFEAGGFVAGAQELVHQRVARGPIAYVARIRRRGISTLQQLSDEAFERGLTALEAWCRTLAPEHVFFHPLDVFVFAAPC